MFTYKIEYTTFDTIELVFSDKEIKEFAEEYKEFIIDTNDDIYTFRDFLSDYLYDFLPCCISNISNDNIEEFYELIKKQM